MAWKAGLSRSREFDWNRFNWRLLAILALIIGGLHCTTPPRAQTSAPCPQDNLDECTRYQHILAGMDSGDLVVQIASLRAASQELDPAFRALIFGKALKSDDLRLRTAGLRYVLASRNTFDVVVERPVHPTPAQQKLYQQYGSLTLRSVKLDEKTDEITAVIFNRVSGSIIKGGPG
jgi:hypothetical protein